MSVTLSLSRCPGCGKYVSEYGGIAMAGGRWCEPCYAAFVRSEAGT